MDDAEVVIFLDAFEAMLDRFFRDFADEAWRFYTTGARGRMDQFESSRAAILQAPFLRKRLAQWRDRTRGDEPSRRLELLERLCIEVDLDGSEEVATLRNDLATIHIQHRARYRGVQTANNELLRVLRFSADREARRQAYLARAQLGEATAAGLVHLMRARNAVAERMGHEEGFYALRLRLEETDADDLDAALDAIERDTEAPYLASLEHRRRAMGVDELQPWDVMFDYAGLRHRLDEYFPTTAQLPRLKRFLAALGFDLDALPITIDAERRDAKSEHAYSFSVHVPDDIRVLFNAEAGFDSNRALCHEIGHALYGVGIRAEPWTLRQSAASCFDEAVARVFETIVRGAAWLERHAGVPADVAARAVQTNAEEEIARLRRSVVLLRFERMAYQDPEQDLSALYWSLIERNLHLPRHHPVPMWARVVHFATHPVYLQTYLFGDMIAAHILHHGEANLGGVLDVPAFGRFLQEEIFAPGASQDWKTRLEQATGSPLEPHRYLDTLLTDVAGP